jgi:hypothetical protein
VVDNSTDRQRQILADGKHRLADIAQHIAADTTGSEQHGYWEMATKRYSGIDSSAESGREMADRYGAMKVAATTAYMVLDNTRSRQQQTARDCGR